MQPPRVTPTKQPASTHTTDTQRQHTATQRRDIQLATIGMETFHLQQSIEQRRPTAGRYTEQHHTTTDKLNVPATPGIEPTEWPTADVDRRPAQQFAPITYRHQFTESPEQHVRPSQQRHIATEQHTQRSVQCASQPTANVRRQHIGVAQPTQQPTCTMPTHEKPIRVLVVGLTGHGKSSLINAIFDKKVAPVEHGARPCQHDGYVTLHRLPFNGKMWYVYDTQGMGDPYVSSSDIFQAIRSELKEVDLMLICHRLYGRAEEATVRMLKQVMSQCGKDLLKRSVLCYTKADEYKVNDNPIPVQKDSLTAAIKPILTRCTLTEEEFDAIPICLTSTRVQYLPTAPNWLDTFWERCDKCFHEGSAPFHEISWFQRHKDTILTTALTVGGGFVGGAFGPRGAIIGAGLASAIGTVYSNYKT